MKTSSVALPFAVQYVWPHPSKRFLYAAWSNGMQGDRHGVTAFRVDSATGALSAHGQPIEIRHRPVHLTLDANATHVLIAYNNPSSLSVHTSEPRRYAWRGSRAARTRRRRHLRASDPRASVEQDGRDGDTG